MNTHRYVSNGFIFFILTLFPGLPSVQAQNSVREWENSPNKVTVKVFSAPCADPVNACGTEKSSGRLVRVTKDGTKAEFCLAKTLSANDINQDRKSVV